MIRLIDPSPVAGLFRRLRPMRDLPMPVKYGLSVLFVLIAASLRGVLSVPLETYPFLLFYPAIIASALLFSGGAGVVAAVVSLVLALWYVPPVESFAVYPHHLLAVGLFAFVALFCALSLEALQATIARLDERTAALERSEREQHTLLVELAHRTRNDLASLSAALTLRARRSPAAAEALLEAVDQVRVLARVHARLDNMGGHVVVDSAECLTGLAHDLEMSPQGGVRLRITVEAASVPLTLDQATALGLVLNELVTNAAKYAFPDGRGTVSVAFAVADGAGLLAVADDGVGMSGEIQGEGVGGVLLEGLARQLGGSFERGAAERGTLATLRFPLNQGPLAGA